MTTLHGEIRCSHAIIHHHGLRRRRCFHCGRTWTLWKRRRGRKKRPRRFAALRRTLEQGLTLTQQAHLQRKPVTTVKARHRELLISLTRQPWHCPIPRGKLILIIDGLWFRFGKKRWTLYLMAVRSIQGTRTVFLRPILRPGRESQEQWREVIDQISVKVRKHICAMISDSLSGIEVVAYAAGWRLQRCHFHLLAGFQVYRGRNKKRLKWRWGRERSYQAVREIIATIDPVKIRTLVRKIRRYTRDPLCPRILRMRLRGALRRLDEYHTYLRYPELGLPSTTGVMESMNARLRGLCGRAHGFRTPQSLERWITAYVRTHSSMTCRPKNLQN